MTSTTLEQARGVLARLDGKGLDEAATTYLLGVLDVDLKEDVVALWDASFVDTDESARIKASVEGLPGPERAELLRVAMLETLEARPDTAPLFAESVADAGQSMFIVELGAVTLAAALLMREYHRKGKSYERHRREITEPDGRKIVEEDEVRYASDGPFARLLVALGLQPPVP